MHSNQVKEWLKRNSDVPNVLARTSGESVNCEVKNGRFFDFSTGAEITSVLEVLGLVYTSGALKLNRYRIAARRGDKPVIADFIKGSSPMDGDRIQFYIAKNGQVIKHQFGNGGSSEEVFNEKVPFRIEGYDRIWWADNNPMGVMENATN